MLEPADDNGGTTITRAITPIGESYSTSFEYNASGIRTKKIWYNPITDATTTTEYKLSGTTILSETTTGAYNRTIRYIYANNELVGFEYNNNAYYYRKNLFGDIVEVYDSENNLVASYTYDAWGNCTIGMNNDGIANVNPFRYRGYYYDWETRYYYLQTRYYDAEVGRFLNADSIEYLDPETINGCNLYAYCLNNPVMYVDPTGEIGLLASIFIGFIVGGIVGGVYGGISTSMTGGNFWQGFGIGAAAGAFMGVFGAVGSSLMIGATTLKVVGGLAISFSSGFIAGTASSIAYQAIEGIPVDELDWGAAIQSGLLWGVLNTVGAAVGIIGSIEGLSLLGNITLSVCSNLIIGAIGLGFDSIINSVRNIKNNKKANITALYILRASA